MLLKINERIKGWLAGVIIAIMGAAFIFIGLESYIGSNANGSKTIATVNGIKITEKQLNRTYQQLKRNQQRAEGGALLSKSVQQQLKQIALEKLIASTALTKAARTAGFHISIPQAQQVLAQAPEFRVNGKFSPRRFQQLLYANQVSESQFLSSIRTQLLINQVALGIQSTAFVLPKELENAYRLIYQTRNFGYFILPKSKFQSSVTISNKDINQYYKQHINQYKTPEKVKISYLLLSPKALEKNIKINPARIRAYYQTNKANYSIPKRWKIARITIALPPTTNQQKMTAATKTLKKIQAQLAQGKTFAALMKQATNAKATTTWISGNRASTTLLNVLSTLQPKQVSKIFHTAEGINLIQLITKTSAKTQSFDTVKAKIKQALLQQQVAQVLAKKNDELSNLTYTNPSSLQTAAKALNIPIQTSPWITHRGSKSGLLSNAVILAVAFSDDVLKNGNNSNPITLKNGSLLVLRVNKHVPSSVKALASVKSQIKQQLFNQKVEAKVGLQAYKISASLNGGTTPQVVAKKYGLPWINKKNISRTNKTIPMPILAAAFSTTPATGKASPGINSLVMANGNYVVIKVFGYKNASYAKPTKKLQKTLLDELTNLSGQIDYKLYAKAILDHATINRKNALN